MLLLHKQLMPPPRALCWRRNQRQAAALAATRAALAKLHAEHRVVLAQLEESTRESYQVSEQLREELRARNARTAELQAQHEQVRARVAQLQDGGRAARLLRSAACRRCFPRRPPCARRSCRRTATRAPRACRPPRRRARPTSPPTLSRCRGR